MPLIIPHRVQGPFNLSYNIPRLFNRRYLTWDSSVFPHPAELQNDVASRGRKTVTIVDPHVKRDPSYNIYQHAQQKQYFVRTKDGGEFDG